MIVRKLNRLLRFQSSAILSTAADFMVTLFMKEVLGLSYLLSTATGSTSGGILNFLLCRNWVFKASQFPAPRQVFRYAFTWSVSILLNIAGVYLLTSVAGFNYILSKLVVSSFIGLTFNFSMQRRFVFRIVHPPVSAKFKVSEAQPVILANQPMVVPVIVNVNRKRKNQTHKKTDESQR